MEEEKKKKPVFTVELLRGISEKEYRALDALSYSRMRDIAEIGKDAVNAPANNSIGHLRGVILGSLVDEMISNKQTSFPKNVCFVNKIPGPETVTQSAIEAINKKFNYVHYEDLNGSDVGNFLLISGFMRNGMNLGNFESKLLNYKEYIYNLKNHQNSVIITNYDKTVVLGAVKRLRKNMFFSENFKNDSKGVSIYYQIKMLANINGIPVKCMFDAIIVDHFKKQIQIIDIKTGVLDKPEFKAFFEEAYLKYGYYIQAGLYRKIAIEYFKNNNKFHDYEVVDFTFVYSTTNPKTHLSVKDLFIHEMGGAAYIDSFKGFSYDGKNYPGIGELFTFYKKHKINTTALPAEANKTN